MAIQIEVDKEKIIEVVKKIENLIDNRQKNYNRMNYDIDMNSVKWQGDDFLAFKKKIEALKKDDSEFKKQISMLQSYVNYLKRCESEYSKAQNRVMNKAKRLPR